MALFNPASSQPATTPTPPSSHPNSTHPPAAVTSLLQQFAPQPPAAVAARPAPPVLPQLPVAHKSATSDQPTPLDAQGQEYEQSLVPSALLEADTPVPRGINHHVMTPLVVFPDAAPPATRAPSVPPQPIGRVTPPPAPTAPQSAAPAAEVSFFVICIV